MNVQMTFFSFYYQKHVDSELSNAFAKKDIACKDERDGKPISKLSQQIKATQNQPKNPFAHYSKFDGEVLYKWNLCS